MSSLVFPITGTPNAVIGIGFDAHKKPMFSSKIAEHAGGQETATSYYPFPKWEYKVTYDYLPDMPKQVGDTDLHNLMGIFLQMRGRGDTFLFQDPDDYSAVTVPQITFDGVTTQLKLVRAIGGYSEPIGQLNTSPALQMWLAVDETFTVPAPSGPYTHTVAHAAAYQQTDSVTINGVAATLAAGAPAAGQYAVAAGVYTFNSADTGKTVDVRYRYLLVLTTDYTITMPNVVTMVTAPASGSVLYATFHYYFVCRFLEDYADFAKFMDKLWNLSEIGFRSIPQ